MVNIKIAVLLILLAPLGIHAQNLTRTGVAKVKVRNTGVILKQGVVKGYYYFYNVEKKEKGVNNYLLSVVDENLREVSSVNIARPATYILIESSYNESTFVFLFFDPRGRTTELISYDNSLTQMGSLTKTVESNAALYAYQSIVLGNQAGQRYLLPVEGEGFILYDPGSITFYDNGLKRVWDSSSPNPNNAATPSEGFVSGRLLGSVVSTQEDKNLRYDLLVNDLNTGQLKFQMSMATGKINVIPNDITYDSVNQQIVIFGEYFNISDNILKAQSLGFCYLLVDLDGKLIATKPVPWSDISQHAPVNEKGKFDGLNSNILFHEFIHTADGQIFAIGEQYKKAVSGAGIGLQVLQIAAMAGGGYYGRTTSTVQMNVYNMVIFQFNSNYALERVHVFEKNKSKIQLPGGSTYASAKLLSYYVKSVGGFDYRFSQMLPGQETFAVIYVDAVPGRKVQLGAIVYTPEKTFSVDKIDFNRRSTEMAITMARPGYVLVTEYYKKEKKLDMRLEKINY